VRQADSALHPLQLLSPRLSLTFLSFCFSPYLLLLLLLTPSPSYPPSTHPYNNTHRLLKDEVIEYLDNVIQMMSYFTYYSAGNKCNTHGTHRSTHTQYNTTRQHTTPHTQHTAQLKLRHTEQLTTQFLPGTIPPEDTTYQPVVSCHVISYHCIS
jgi:hypothetical protein